MPSPYAHFRPYLFPQEKENTCGVASVRTVLALQYGLVLTEAELELLGTTARMPIEREGLNNAGIRRMLRNAWIAFREKDHKPWRATVRLNGKLSDLKAQCRKGRFPMPTVTTVHKNLETQLHIIVVLGVDATHVHVHDPALDKAIIKRVPHKKFIKWWTRVDGATEYVTITGGEPLSNPSK